MKVTASTVVFSLFIVGIYAATAKPDFPAPESATDFPSTIDIDKKKTTTTTVPTTASETTSTAATPTSTTTEPSTTAAVPTTTTTVAPTTSSTTVAPTTSTTPAPTTTSAPTTTPSPAPTPKPTPPKNPDVGKYDFTENNKTCILLEFAAQLNVSYTNANNVSDWFVHNLPNDTAKVITGSCGNGSSDQFVTIGWAGNTLNLTFGLKEKEKNFMLKEIAVELASGVVPGTENSTKLYSVEPTAETPRDKSYHCTRVLPVGLFNATVNGTKVGHIDFSHSQIQAFRSEKNQNFSLSVDCDGIGTPDIVPIAVGIALIALVVVVLIAYIVGRRRAQAQGYVSM